MIAQGLLAYVDLTEGRVEYAQTPEALVERYLGGRGLNMYYLLKLIRPDTDPFSPANPLIFGNGLLTGSYAPTASRWSVSARAPETTILGDANAGGHFGAEMKKAGFDRLIIRGRANAPCYLYLEAGRVEIREGGAYWGMSCREVQEQLRSDLGKNIQIACIGPPGENRVRFAAVMHAKKAAAARGGLGAVMGSKHLKAIVARESPKLAVADERGMLAYRKELIPYLNNSGVVKVLGKYGTPFLYRPSNVLGAIRTKNSQLNAFEESLNAEEIHKYLDKMTSCFACNVHCRPHNRLGGEGPEYSTVGLLGANIGIGDPEAVVRLNNLCNDLGFDTTSAGTILAWACELYERGIIDERMTGRPLRWGDYEGMRQLLEEIAYRRGFGDILAESTQAWQVFGEASKDYLIAVKGLPQTDPHDVRILKGFALGIAVASRGADHLRNRPTLEIMTLPAEVKEKLYGAPVNPEITAYDTKEIVVKFSEDIYAVNDALGLCRFVCHGFNSPHLLTYDHYARLVELASGARYGPEYLRQVGILINDTERLLNARFGLGRGDDTLPKRYFDDGMPLKGYRGERIDRREFEAMLTRYYALRGWHADGTLPAGRVREIEDLLACEEAPALAAAG
jgi:aldehyde:ferredoxin oxidoreductase